MVEKVINHRWYRRFTRKATKSDSRRHHSARPKHSYEKFYREARIESDPLHEERPLFFGLGCIDIPKLQDQRRSESRTQSRLAPFRASMAGIFEDRPYNSSFHDFTKRDIPDRTSTSGRRTFPYVKSESYHEDYIPFPSFSRNDDLYHADDMRYANISEPVTMRRCSDAVSKDNFGHLYDDPYFYNQGPTCNMHSITNPYEDYAYVYGGIDEEDLDTLLSPSIISLYPQDANSLSHHHDILRIEPAPLHEDEALFGGVSSRIYDPLATHVDESPVSETIKEIMIDAAGVVTEMMESIFQRETLHPTLIPNQNLKQHQDPPFMSSYTSEPFHTNLSDFIQRMRRQTQPQPSPPPPPRPQFVDPFQIPLRRPVPEPRQETKDSPRLDSTAELARYNKWWTDAQNKSVSKEKVLDNVPCLSPPHSKSTHDWTWTTHQFFCRAFDLQPVSIPQQDTSNLHTFTTSLTFPKETRTKLLALRAQLKLEKVRWHEDKLRSLFGDGVARDERSKCVWGAIMGLRGLVEKALEGEA